MQLSVLNEPVKLIVQTLHLIRRFHGVLIHESVTEAASENNAKYNRCK